MADAPTSRPVIAVALFVGLALALMALRLMPLTTSAPTWAPPDLMLAGTVAVVLRRPAYAPVWVIAALFLLADLLHHRPPGAEAAVVTIVTELLRARARNLRDGPLIPEVIAGLIGITAALIGTRVLLMLFATPRPALPLALTELALTLAVYPLVLGALAVVFGLQRAAPGAVDARGRPL